MTLLSLQNQRRLPTVRTVKCRYLFHLFILDQAHYPLVCVFWPVTLSTVHVICLFRSSIIQQSSDTSHTRAPGRSPRPVGVVLPGFLRGSSRQSRVLRDSFPTRPSATDCHQTVVETLINRGVASPAEDFHGPLRRRLQLRFDFGSTAIRLQFDGVTTVGLPLCTAA